MPATGTSLTLGYSTRSRSGKSILTYSARLFYVSARWRIRLSFKKMKPLQYAETTDALVLSAECTAIAVRMVAGGAPKLYGVSVEGATLAMLIAQGLSTAFTWQGSADSKEWATTVGQPHGPIPTLLRTLMARGQL